MEPLLYAHALASVLSTNRELPAREKWEYLGYTDPNIVMYTAKEDDKDYDIVIEQDSDCTISAKISIPGKETVTSVIGFASFTPRHRQ